ncbi:MAG: hypothetical protein SPF69_02665 [Candidatus Ornithospirochaeta sp.]|nr:hypothetical protein [Sphaerochaetaceae bacterium]MDY5522975.1 hypothetical protein [Candidatus Ornithospirochaeta sp.]
MKKFSVLLVAILALMMLFVSCENEPKKRAATKEDGEIIKGLIMSAIAIAESDNPVYKETVVRSYNEYEDTITFKKAEYTDPKGNVAVLNGTMTMKDDKETSTFSVDFEDGTKYKGVDHTLFANVVVKQAEKGKVDSYEIILDGVILEDFDFDSLYEK